MSATLIRQINIKLGEGESIISLKVYDYNGTILMRLPVFQPLEISTSQVDDLIQKLSIISIVMHHEEEDVRDGYSLEPAVNVERQ